MTGTGCRCFRVRWGTSAPPPPDGPERIERNAPLDAVGFAEGSPGRPYVLAWRVQPRGREYPVLLIDANDGSVLFRDSGIRCVVAPCP